MQDYKSGVHFSFIEMAKKNCRRYIYIYYSLLFITLFCHYQNCHTTASSIVEIFWLSSYSDPFIFLNEKHIYKLKKKVWHVVNDVSTNMQNLDVE